MDLHTLPPGNPPADLATRIRALGDELNDTLSIYPADSEIRRLLSAADHALEATTSCVALAASMVDDQRSAARLEDAMTQLLRSES